MLKLSKDQQKKIEDLRTRWTAAREQLDSEQDDANEKIGAIEAAVNEKIADLNALVEEANSLREEIEADAQNYYDEKSEKWQEGERGSAYNDWISSWQDEVEEIETVSIDTVAKVEDVPETLLSDDTYPTEPSN
jgi:chromosome segregation ATPase